VAVLSLDTISDGVWSRSKLGGLQVSEAPKLNHVTVTTVRRFKGLEASLLFLVDVDFKRATESMWRLLLYVGCSRARHAVHLVTTTPEADLEGAVRVFSDSEKARPSWRALCRCLGVRPSGGSNDPFK
jgi:hypothetical protein